MTYTLRYVHGGSFTSEFLERGTAKECLEAAAEMIRCRLGTPKEIKRHTGPAAGSVAVDEAGIKRFADWFNDPRHRRELRHKRQDEREAQDAATKAAMETMPGYGMF